MTDGPFVANSSKVYGENTVFSFGGILHHKYEPEKCMQYFPEISEVPLMESVIFSNLEKDICKSTCL